MQKFVDCRSKDLERREIYRGGDSALGSCKRARRRVQAIIPVRGKMLNCLKADFNKILKNDIITDLIKVLGCGIRPYQGHEGAFLLRPLTAPLEQNYHMHRHRRGRFQIRTLILAMLYRRTLIEKESISPNRPFTR